MSSVLHLKIKNWNKHNPRKDVKKCSWFKLHHDFLLTSKFCDFGATDIAVFIALLCHASRDSKDSIWVDTKKLSDQLRVKNDTILISIRKLIERGTILKIRNVNVTPELDIELERELELEKTLAQTAKTVRASVCLDDLYKIYPKKVGKKKGLEKAKTCIKTEQDFQRCLSAIEKYKQDCVKNKTEDRYIKHFSTFMNSWEDWLDDTTGSVDMPNKKSSAQEWLEESLREERVVSGQD